MQAAGSPARKPGRSEAGGPIRQCRVCRRRAPREELLRLIGGPDSQGWILDARQRGGGRGSYVCPRQRCLARLGLTVEAARAALALEAREVASLTRRARLGVPAGSDLARRQRRMAAYERGLARGGD